MSLSHLSTPRVRSIPRRICLVGAALWMASGFPAFAAKPPVPAVRLPLADLGFPGYTLALMHAGASMATVHMLDNTHLLFTYSLRSLVPRLPGDDENDSDRLVAAEVVQIPSGKILARTQWHLHDHARYLWRLGHGVFVLRSADRLATFTPLRGLASGNAFLLTALPHRPGMPALIQSSPDSQIVTVQFQEKPSGEDSSSGSADLPRQRHTVLEFYRLVVPEQPDQPIDLQPAGAIGAPGLLRLALDGDGYLWAEDARRDRWSVSFNEYRGKAQDLTAVDSSCNPVLQLLSRSEFAVLSCNGSDDSRTLSSYGFDGHENWQEPFGDDLQAPVFVTAPDAGRFALSRLNASSAAATPGVLALPDSVLSQEVRVYQTESGDLLLDLQCVPVARSPENFDLSPDGRTLAVLGNDSINLYRLPELTARDRKDLAAVRSMTPPLATGAVELRRITRPIAPEEAAAPASRVTDAASPTPAAPGDASSAATRPPGTKLASATAAPVLAPAAGPPQPASSATPGPTPGLAPGPNPGLTPGSTPGSATQASGKTAPAEAAASSSAAAVDTSSAPRKRPTLLAPGESPEFKAPDSAPQ